MDFFFVLVLNGKLYSTCYDLSRSLKLKNHGRYDYATVAAWTDDEIYNNQAVHLFNNNQYRVKYNAWSKEILVKRSFVSVYSRNISVFRATQEQ